MNIENRKREKEYKQCKKTIVTNKRKKQSKLHFLKNVTSFSKHVIPFSSCVCFSFICSPKLSPKRRKQRKEVKEKR
jgi:amino acid permease